MNPESSRQTAATRTEHAQILDQFRHAWQSGGARPNLADFVPTDGPERRSLLIELVRVDMEFRRQAGLPAHVSQYLETFPELGDSGAGQAKQTGKQFARARRNRPAPQRPSTSPKCPRTSNTTR